MDAARAILGEIDKRRDVSRRFLVAIAGAPGSGKSTVAETLCAMANDRAAGTAEVLPMDGYHFDNCVLEARGDLPRKGAPHTFDAPGFIALLGRIRSREPDIAVPVFDRSIDLARAGARIIGDAVPLVIVEGNYLLLDDPRWRDAADLFDLKVFLDVPEAELERRLIQRWLDYGHDEASARAKALGNDIPNARLVTRHSVGADLVVGNY